MKFFSHVKFEIRVFFSVEKLVTTVIDLAQGIATTKYDMTLLTFWYFSTIERLTHKFNEKIRA